MDTCKFEYEFQRRPVPETTARDLQFVRLSRARVRVEIQGQGPVLVTSPDPPNVIEQNRELNKLLAQFATVVCFEQPGFGYSRVHSGFDFSFQHYRDALIELLEALKLRDVVMAVPCIGGFAAIGVARLRPDLVSKLVLLQTPSLPYAQRWLAGVSVFGLLTAPPLGQLMVRAFPKTCARAWYALATPHVRELGLLENTVAALDRGADNCMASALQGFKNITDSHVGSQPLSQPGLVIWGANDRTHRLTDRASSRQFLPTAELIELPASHFPELEKPLAVVAAIRAFMKESD